MDVLSSELGQNDLRLVWYENLTILATSEALLRQLKIYPNPATKTIFVESEVPIDLIQLYTATGKLVKVQRTPINGIEVDSLEAGLYFLKIEIGKKSVTQKVILE